MQIMGAEFEHHVWEFMPEFAEALQAQLEKDEKRWGDTWLHRDVGGQNQRIFAHYRDYEDQWKNAGVPVNWLKVAGDAMIAWIRENHPEILQE